MKTRKLHFRAKSRNKIDDEYHKYVIRYNRAEKRLQRKGQEMVDVKYTKEEFKATYEAAKNDLQIEVAQGNRKVVGDVVGKLIDKQKYSISNKQAQAIRFNWKRFQRMDDRMTHMRKPKAVDIRSGEAFDFDFLHDYYYDLKDQGLTGEEAKKRISRDFFGSN